MFRSYSLRGFHHIPTRIQSFVSSIIVGTDDIVPSYPNAHHFILSTIDAGIFSSSAADEIGEYFRQSHVCTLSMAPGLRGCDELFTCS